MKMSCFFIIVLGIHLNVMSQEHAVIRSPQVSDMIRFNNTSVAKTSGRLDLNINLLDVNDIDFHLPVNLSYNSSGYIPSKGESSVGLNWSLIAGGAIYREVRGMPDDWEDDNSDFHEQGFLHVVKGGSVCSAAQLWQTPANYLENNKLAGVIQIKNTRIESSSDIYHFSFGPYSGKFTLNFDGSVSVAGKDGGHFKVDVSDYNYFKLSNTSTIRITTDDGYVYSFGGDWDNVEYTLKCKKDGQCSTIHDYYISSFHLSQIIAPNGRSLHVKYHHLSPKYHDPYELFRFDNNMSSEDAINYTLSSVSSAAVAINQPTYIDGSWQWGNSAGTDFSYLFIKSALVEEITTDFQTIKFHYSLKGFNPYEIDNSWRKSCGAKLDSICSFDNQNKRCRKLIFNYSYFGGDHKRYFLTKLHLSEHESYNFDYNIRTLPDPTTTGIDYWNYWQGTLEGGRLIPSMILYNNGDFKYASGDREPTGKGYDTGLLHKITYPTGGYSEIYYEPHSYSSVI